MFHRFHPGSFLFLALPLILTLVSGVWFSAAVRRRPAAGGRAASGKTPLPHNVIDPKSLLY